MTREDATTLFGLDVQYTIPLFQRHYVWDEENQWEPLWLDLKEKSFNRTDKQQTPHFTGTIVIQQQNTPGRVRKYEIIDGQQRLTTFQIILCAIRDILKSEKQDDEVNNVQRYIRNQNTQLSNEEKYKLLPTERDRDAFISLVDEHENTSNGKIGNAYDYFKREIKDHVKSDMEKVQELFQSLLEDFGFVQILIDTDDEPEKIFESLNARGKSLLQFDLLRNNLFLRAHKDKDRFYEEYWKHFEDRYWDPEEKSGADCELFLQHFLMAKLGRADVKPEFNTYQRRYTKNLKASIEHEFAELKRYSDTYTEMTNCSKDSDIGKRMKFYQTFDLTTLHPFILFVTREAGVSEDELTLIFDILESYTLRRMLCCGGRRGLLRFNIFFSQAIDELKQNGFSFKKFIDLLDRQCSDTHKYPADEEIPSALHTHYEADSTLFPDDSTIVFPNNQTFRVALQGRWGDTAGALRKRLIRYVLYRIEQIKQDRDPYMEPVITFGDDLTLEHVLPQAWTEKWDLPISNGSITYDGTGSNPQISVNRELGVDSVLYADLFTSDYKKKNTNWKAKPSREGLAEASYLDAFNLALARDHCLESIGNLTLITKRLNSKLGNSTFPERRETLREHSILKLNSEICEQDAWDVNEIQERAERLIDDVCQIWPSLDVFKKDHL